MGHKGAGMTQTAKPSTPALLTAALAIPMWFLSSPSAGGRSTGYVDPGPAPGMEVLAPEEAADAAPGTPGPAASPPASQAEGGLEAHLGEAPGEVPGVPELAPPEAPLPSTEPPSDATGINETPLPTCGLTPAAVRIQAGLDGSPAELLTPFASGELADTGPPAVIPPIASSTPDGASPEGPSTDLAPSGEPTASPTPGDSTTPTPSATPGIRAAATESPTASETPSPTESLTATETPTLAETPTHTESPTPSETPTPTESPTPSETPTSTASPTASPTPTLLLASLRSFPPGAVSINEIAWAGTLASSSDEWIELNNPGAQPIDLTGWRLTDGGDIDRTLAGTLEPGGYFLLERTDDATVSDIPADLTYTGSLRNEGETLELLDPAGAVIDRANASGGAWPAGDRATRASMQRSGPDDAWDTYPGCGGNGTDADGAPIQGTPRQANAAGCVTATPTGTASPTLAPLPTSVGPGAVRINEVAWAGTHASASDEWIELFNPSPQEFDLAGWRLTDSGDLDIPLSGRLPSGGFFLLERSDDQTISDIPADAVYTGALSNDGEALELLDPTGAPVDVANPEGGAWPAGSDEAHASMERATLGGWGTFTGYFGNGHDADGNRVSGTPRQANSLLFPTPAPTGIPGRVVVNEALVRPHYDWEGTGGVDTGDEFVELYNRGPHDVRLGGWILDDVPDGGSKPFVLPDRRIQAGGYAVFFRSQTRLALNDSGDTVVLRAPDGRTVDAVSYSRVSAYNLAVGRLPDGSGSLAYGLWPTPGEANRVYSPPSFPAGSIRISEVAWAGTRASAEDEWIEIWNPGSVAVSLFGWTLTDDSDIEIELSGTLGPDGYLLLERTDDKTIPDLVAGAIYRGALSNDGERLRLLDPSGGEVDVVNPAGGPWPAGDADGRGSMERDGDQWHSFAGEAGRGRDAAGWPVRGTPGMVNSRALEASLATSGACGVGHSPAAGACP